MGVEGDNLLVQIIFSFYLSTLHVDEGGGGRRHPVDIPQYAPTGVETCFFLVVIRGGRARVLLRVCVGCMQGPIKRGRLFWLTNSALVYESKCGGMGGGGEVTESQPMSTAVYIT